MESGRIITADQEIKEMLEQTKTIAILGLCPKPQRDSYMVAKYLQAKGYRIIPVRPGQKEMLGEKAYASLDDIKEPVDMVDVFRNPAQLMPHVHEALRLKPKVFWMQLDIESREAAELLTAAGINVVMNRCTKIEYDKLFDR